MHEIMTLVRPRILSFKNNSISGNQKRSWPKYLILGIIGVLFWGLIFAVSLRVLGYFRGIEEIGDIIAFKFLSMLLIICFSLLIFSSIITCLSRLYLSQDLSLVHAMPVPPYKIFMARWTDSTVESAWMVVVYTLPIFIAYGIAFETGAGYYLFTLSSLVSLSVISASISGILVMAAVMIIPANRMKNIFIFIGLFLFIILYMAFRLLKPETLVDPDVFMTALTYIKKVQTPASPFLPSTWAFDTVRAGLSGQSGEFWGGWFHQLLSWSFAGMIFILAVLTANRFYFKGLSKTHTAQIRVFKEHYGNRSMIRFLPRPVRALVLKEIQCFFRDQSQWTQLFLIGALVIIYTYNFKVLPLEKSPVPTIYLQNLFAFLNMGLSLFVLTAITARFAFPAVSTERDAFWIIKNAPVTLKTFLWIKFLVYYFPLLLLSELLIIVTNLFLHVTPFMMTLSSVTVFCLVPGIVSMGIGFGAAYPDFKAENPAQTVTGFGGILFMLVSAGYIGSIIVLEAGPVYNLFMAGLRGKTVSVGGWLWITGAFCLCFIISVIAVLLPMRFGEKRLTALFS